MRHWCHNEVVSLKSSVANNKNMYKQRPTRIFQFLLALVLVSNRCSQLASMENTFQEYFQSNLIMMLSSNREQQLTLVWIATFISCSGVVGGVLSSPSKMFTGIQATFLELR